MSLMPKPGPLLHEASFYKSSPGNRVRRKGRMGVGNGQKTGIWKSEGGHRLALGSVTDMEKGL
jgi:hypothetical protein